MSDGSLTHWTRLEPKCRSNDHSEALEARIVDPLWQLARQWQFGEFLGEDAGSPVGVRVRGHTKSLTHYSPTLPGEQAKIQSYDPMSRPLEVIVEQERLNIRATDLDYDPLSSLWRAIETGQHLIRLLKYAGGRAAEAVDNFKSPLGYELVEPTAETLAKMDLNGARKLNLLYGKVPDGVKRVLTQHARRSHARP